MELNKKYAMALFVGLGFKTADGWSPKKMEVKLNRLPRLVDEDAEVEDKKLNKIFQQVKEAVEKKEAITIAKSDEEKEEDAKEEKAAKVETEAAEKEEKKSKKSSKKDEEEAEEEKPAKKSSKKDEEEKPAKKEKKAPKEKDGDKWDALGCRIGSQSAKINEALGKKPKTIEELAKETGLKVGRVQNHVRAHVAKGSIIKSDKGYALKG